MSHQTKRSQLKASEFMFQTREYDNREPDHKAIYRVRNKEHIFLAYCQKCNGYRTWDHKRCCALCGEEIVKWRHRPSD